MKKKLLVVLALVLGLSLMFATLALAHYSSVIGELRDTKTQALWQWGGTVNVFNCFTGVSLGTQVLPPGSSSFNIPIAPPIGYVPICIEVDFATCSGCPDPGNAAKGIYPSFDSTSGTLDTGPYFAGTGPNAVTLTNITARSANTWLPVGLVAGLSVLALGALFALRKRRALS